MISSINLVGWKVEEIDFALFAVESHLENCGSIQSAEDLGKHNFVVLDECLSQLAVNLIDGS